MDTMDRSMWIAVGIAAVVILFVSAVLDYRDRNP